METKLNNKKLGSFTSAIFSRLNINLHQYLEVAHWGRNFISRECCKQFCSVLLCIVSWYVIRDVWRCHADLGNHAVCSPISNDYFVEGLLILSTLWVSINDFHLTRHFILYAILYIHRPGKCQMSPCFTTAGIFVDIINIVNGFKRQVFTPKYCTNTRFPLDMLQEVHIIHRAEQTKSVTQKHGSHSVVDRLSKMTDVTFVREIYLGSLPVLLKETRRSFDELQTSIDSSIKSLPQENKERNVLPNVSFVTLTLGSLVLVCLYCLYLWDGYFYHFYTSVIIHNTISLSI